MAKKTPIDKFEDAITKILDDYGDEVRENLDAITENVGKAGVTLMRNQSKQTFPNGTGFYAKGWTKADITSRNGTTVILHNKHSGMPHLLEFGHAKRGGGRVPGRTHIATVESEIVEQYTAEVVNKL